MKFSHCAIPAAGELGLSALLFGLTPDSWYKLPRIPAVAAFEYPILVKKFQTFWAVSEPDISAPEFVSGKYYAADIAPRLPLPDEIASIMAA